MWAHFGPHRIYNPSEITPIKASDNSMCALTLGPIAPTIPQNIPQTIPQKLQCVSSIWIPVASCNPSDNHSEHSMCELTVDTNHPIQSLRQSLSRLKQTKKNSCRCVHCLLCLCLFCIFHFPGGVFSRGRNQDPREKTLPGKMENAEDAENAEKQKYREICIFCIFCIFCRRNHFWDD